MVGLTIRQSLHKSGLSSRLVKWYIEHTEFDIDYKLLKSIKAQALANFIVERSVIEEVIHAQVMGVTLAQAPKNVSSLEPIVPL